jgi:hypothetical protein
VLPSKKDESVVKFMENLENFVTDLDVAMVNLRDSVQLSPCTVDLEAYKKPTDFVNATHNPEVMGALEGRGRGGCCCVLRVVSAFWSRGLGPLTPRLPIDDAPPPPHMHTPPLTSPGGRVVQAN